MTEPATSELMHKLAIPDGDGWAPHSHPPTFAIATTSADTGSAQSYLVAGVPGGDVAVLRKLTTCLAAPFYILYVLHTPRGEGDAGRYQSPPVQDAELGDFLSRYAAFFKSDARFDLWIHSPDSRGTLVWDRHNLLYGYGPVECYAEALRTLGFSDGQPDIPAPHQHFYRPECDADAAGVLGAFSWTCSPLQAEDEQ